MDSSTLADGLTALSHRQQRELLVRLLRHPPQGDTPFGNGQPGPVGADLEVLFDFREYHLPELEDRGFVDYNRESHQVTRGPNFGEIEPLVRLIDDHRDELPDDWL